MHVNKNTKNTVVLVLDDCNKKIMCIFAAPDAQPYATFHSPYDGFIAWALLDPR